MVLQDRQRVVYEEQKKLVQQQAQTKAQMARYEDELARKRMQVSFLFIFLSFFLFFSLLCVCLSVLGGICWKGWGLGLILVSFRAAHYTGFLYRCICSAFFAVGSFSFPFFLSGYPMCLFCQHD